MHKNTPGLQLFQVGVNAPSPCPCHAVAHARTLDREWLLAKSLSETTTFCKLQEFRVKYYRLGLSAQLTVNTADNYNVNHALPFIRMFEAWSASLVCLSLTYINIFI